MVPDYFATTSLPTKHSFATMQKHTDNSMAGDGSLADAQLEVTRSTNSDGATEYRSPDAKALALPFSFPRLSFDHKEPKKATEANLCISGGLLQSLSMDIERGYKRDPVTDYFTYPRFLMFASKDKKECALNREILGQYVETQVGDTEWALEGYQYSANLTLYAYKGRSENVNSPTSFGSCVITLPDDQSFRERVISQPGTTTLLMEPFPIPLKDKPWSKTIWISELNGETGVECRWHGLSRQEGMGLWVPNKPITLETKFDKPQEKAVLKGELTVVIHPPMEKVQTEIRPQVPPRRYIDWYH